MATRSSLQPLNGAILAIALAALLLVACTSKPKEKVAEGRTKTTANAASNDHFDGGTYCVQTFLQGPAPVQPLHFSVKVTESDQTLKSKDFQGDLSGDTFDIVHHDHWLATELDKDIFRESQGANSKVVTREIRDGFADETVTNHYTRSDEVGWRGGTIGITQGGTPWGLFIYKPTVTRVGPENVNGFETIKYAIDTTQETSIEKAAGFLRQLKDYNITGTAWVLKDANCVLNYDITDQQIENDGKTKTTHYEGTVTRKSASNSETNVAKSAS